MLSNLKLLRKEKGISQQQLADVIGVSQQSINKYENHNIEPDIATLVSLADFFNASVDFIVGHSEIRNKAEKTEAFELNKEETELINNFRAINKDEKISVLLIIKNYLNK